MLRSAEQTIGDSDGYNTQKFAFERTNLLNYCRSDFVNSKLMVEEYFRSQLSEIEEYGIVPSEASRLYDNLKQDIQAVLQQSTIKQPLLLLRIEIEKQAQRFERKTTRANLVGSKVVLPETSWLNEDKTADIKPDDLVLWYFFASKQRAQIHDEIIELQKTLNEDHSHVKAMLMSNSINESFKQLSIVNRATKPTQEAQQKFRDRLVAEFIKPNQIEFPVGILLDTIAVSDRLGIDSVPFAMLVKNGVCLWSYSGKNVAAAIAEQLKQFKTP